MPSRRSGNAKKIGSASSILLLRYILDSVEMLFIRDADTLVIRDKTYSFGF